MCIRDSAYVLKEEDLVRACQLLKEGLELYQEVAHKAPV